MERQLQSDQMGVAPPDRIQRAEHLPPRDAIDFGRDRLWQVGTSRVASKVFDITGSAGGFPQYDATNTSPISTFAGSSGADGGTVILFVAGSNGASDECSFEFNAVFSSISLGSTQDGEATVSFNFEMAQDPATAPTFTW